MKAVARAVVSWRRTASVLAALGFVLAFVTAPTPSAADSQPPTGVPATVTADVLPTVQIDGIVRAEAIYRNTVYAVGQFTTARPPQGVAGTPQTRTNILAYNITTGALDMSFVHTLDGTGAEGRAVAVSPDGTRLYIGGWFATADGQAHKNFVAFDLTAPGTPVVAGFAGPDNKVLAVAATNSDVYIGGVFEDSGGRTLVAAYEYNGDPKPGWDVGVTSPAPGAHVAALTVAGSNLIVGGSFDQLSSGADTEPRYSIGAVTLDAGAIVTPWMSSSADPAVYPISEQPPSGARADNLGITSLRTDPDGTKVYLGAFTFVPGPRPGTFEGTAAIDPTDGHVIFLDDCAGDTHDVFPIGKVLYSVSHAHNCTPMNGYPQLPNNYQHALAETTYVTGVNGPGIGGNYADFQGVARGELLNWFPTFDTGTASGGANDAGWSVVGNADYLAIGGEFLHVNGVAQQGLVRFAVKAHAPNKVGPSRYPGTYGVSAYPANSLGQSFVRVFNVSDQDNGLLTYRVYRSGSTHLIITRTLDSRFWWARSFTFRDTHLPPGTSADYRVVVTDPLGNRRTLDAVTAVNDTDGRIIYRGTWKSLQGRSDARPDFYRGIHYARANGASYSYSFYGRSVRIIGERGPDQGTAAVSIDGRRVGTMSATQPARLYQQQLFAKYDLPLGRHTVTVRKIGGDLLELDALRVTPDTGYDDPSGSISYSRRTGWVSHQNSTTRHFGRGVHYTRHNGATATVHFRGTQVILVSPTGRPFGKARVSIDGRAPVTISEYRAASTRYQQIVFTRRGLSAGAHTMKITKVSGTYLEIDAAFSR